MRLDLLFTILTIPVAICAVMLGDSMNIAFKAHIEAESGGSVFFIFVCGFLAVFTALAIYTYIDEYFDSSEDYREQIEKGLTIAASAFFGLILFGMFVGPINNGQYAWFNGWSFMALVAVLPALLNLNTLIKEALEDRRARNSATQLNDGVTPIKRNK